MTSAWYSSGIGVEASLCLMSATMAPGSRPLAFRPMSIRRDTSSRSITVDVGLMRTVATSWSCTCPPVGVSIRRFLIDDRLLRLSGGVLAAFVFRTDMTLPTLAGFIAVLALAVRGGIAVLTRAGALEAEDGRRTRATAVVEAAGERLGPFLTTVVATMVALIPLIVTGTIPGQEIAQPIAIVVFGGLITTTLVTAFIVPAIYTVLGPRREAEEPETIELATT